MPVTTTYVTLAAMKATLNLTGSTFDNDLNASIAAASRGIDGVCNRRFYLDADDTSVRYYTPTSAGLLEIDDLNDLNTLVTDATGAGSFTQTWTLHTDFELEPLNAQADPNDLWPYTRIKVRRNTTLCLPCGWDRSVQLTAQFGWAAVPDAIVEGATLLTERLFKIKREAPLGVLAFQDIAVRIARTDPQMQATIGRYMKHAAAVA